MGARKIKNGEDYVLELGNLDPIREWGHARDYAYAMWITLQQEKPTDYIMSTGVGYSVRELVEKVFKKVGISVTWEGTGIDEVGKDQNGKIIVKVSSDYIRPYDPSVLVGNPEKFKNITGFEIKNDIDELIESMLEA